MRFEAVPTLGTFGAKYTYKMTPGVTLRSEAVVKCKIRYSYVHSPIRWGLLLKISKKPYQKEYDYQACEDIFKTINREIDSITFRTDILNKNKF